LGMVTEVRPLHLSKAASIIIFTTLPMVTAVKPLL
jgi:hypothetical protein